MNKIQSIEYSYAFDIHCNSFVPLYLFTSSAQYIILPLLNGNGKLGLVLGNALFTVGMLYYFIVTTSGYYAMPFIERSNNINKIIYSVIGFFTFLTITGVNCAHYFINFNFN